MTTTVRVAPAAPTRTFGYFRTAYAFAQHGDGLYQVALPLAALSVSSRPSAAAVTAFAARLPWLVLALPAGSVVDRVDRHRLLRVANLLRAAVLAVLAAAMTVTQVRLWMVAAAALLVGAAETVHETTAHTAVARLVPAGGLTRANGQMQAVEFVANHFLGPAVGGLLAALAIGWALGGSAGLFLVAAVVFLAVPHPRVGADDQPDAPGRRHRMSMRQALGTMLRDPVLRAYAVGLGVINVAITGYYAVLPVIVVRGSDGGGRTLGLVLAAGGAGGLLVSLASHRLLAWLGPRRGLTAGAVGLVIGLGTPALTHNPVMIGAGMAVTGLLVLLNIVTVTYRQTAVPDAVLGRVTACYRLLAWGAMPAGPALAGVVAELAGPRWVCLGAAVTIAVVAVPVARATARTGEST